MKKENAKIKPADSFFWINADDKNLTRIKIPLPKSPPIETIDGYELPIEQQVFQKQKYPAKLKKLERDCAGVLDDLWTRLNKNQSGYKEEIAWIKKQWYYRLNGYWFMNNGQPTYIDGWHWFYLNHFHLDIGLPFYYDRDRRWFITQRYFYNTTFDFKDKDEKGNVIPNKDGEYEMYDTGRPIFSGVINIKGRRRGDTYKNGCVGYEVITRASDADQTYGIQANDAEGAYIAYTKVKHAWKKTAWYFMPEYDNSSNPEGGIYFNTPSKRGANVINTETGLESSIRYATTADRNFFDKTKLIFFTDDEGGKVALENIIKRWQVVRKCLYVGANRNGFAIFTTTSGEMGRGGANFKELCDQSNYYIRNENGETASGLINVFWNAADAYEGYIDKYGMSVMEEPTDEQKKDLKIKIGARQFLLNDRNIYLQKGDEESLKVYREKKRLDPLEYADCFLTETGDIGMPYEKIDARLGELMFDRTSTKRGNYNRMDDKPEGRVVWEDDPNGKWIISHELPFNQTNQKFFSNGTYIPIAPRFMASADTFRLNKTAGSRMSDGGGAVFWIRDKIIDPDDKDIKLWTTNRFVCTYQARPPLEIYCEDMLMMCEYWGAWMNPEINIANIIDHFTRRGRAGYLFYAIDKATGRMRNTPGYSSLGASKQEMFNLFISHLQNHCHREKHAELLNDCKNLKGLDDMTNFDRWAAAAGCLKGASEIWEAPIFLKQDKVDVGNFFTPRRV